MTSVRLGDIVTYTRGITFKPADKVEPHSSGSVVCMRTANVQEDLDQSDLIAVPEAFVRRDELYLRPGDILVSSANSWNLVGKCCQVPQLDYPATAGGFISIVRPKESKVDATYLYRWLSSKPVQHRVRHLARQTTNISNLPVEPFVDLVLPLPPLPEQKRIAAILDKADAIRRKRQQAIQLADEFLRATFLDMFGDPVTNPKGWPEKRVGDLLADKPDAIRTGPFGSQLRHSEFTEEGEVPVLGIDNVVTNSFRWAKPRYLSAERFSQFRRYTVFPEDVLITIMGTTGRVAVAPQDLLTCMNTKHLCALTLNRELMDPWYLWATIMFDSRVRGQTRVAGGGAIMEGWNMGIIKDLRVRVPPIELQAKFRCVREKISHLAALKVQGVGGASELSASLSQRAFAGTL